jgi:predicted glutamine amidotransferase
MHNGLIREFARVKRELVLAVDDSLFPSIEGTTDSETMFYLALTFGVEDDPVAAVEQMIGVVEETGKAHGVEYPIQMTVATTDGRSIWAFRYSSEHDSRSLHFSTRMDSLKAMYPDRARFELAVAAAAESVPTGLAAGGGDWCDAGEPREAGFGAQAAAV